MSEKATLTGGGQVILGKSKNTKYTVDMWGTMCVWYNVCVVKVVF